MPRLLDHIDLRVPDLAAAAPFYEALLPALGFTRHVDIPGWLQFEAPPAPPAGSAPDDPAAPSSPPATPAPTDFFGLTADPAHRPNSTRIAFAAASRAAVDALAVRFPAFGARAIEGPDFESPGYYAVYFEDPFGNRLELCHREISFTA